jgi:prepilin-type N-terminal cleavage/methylation domain-containing protein
MRGLTLIELLCVMAIIPFAGSDPDEQVVIKVRLRKGFFADMRNLEATKGEITRPSD